MEFSLNSLWTTLSSGKVQSRRQNPCILNLAIDPVEKVCDAYLEVAGEKEEVDLADKDMLWMFTAYTCACCGLRERKLHCEADDVENAKENFHNKYPWLKSVEVGSDVRRVARLELAFQDGDILSVGFQCSSKEDQREFETLTCSLVKLGNLKACKSCGCNTRRRAHTSDDHIHVKEDNCVAVEEADRHMRELLEITKIEETNSAKSSERKKIKRKSGKAVRSKALHIAAEMQLETPSADVQKGNNHLVFDGSQHNIDDEFNKSAQSTLGDRCIPVTTDLKKDCQDCASCADSAQEASANMHLKEGPCSTTVPDDPIMTVEKALDEHMQVEETCDAVEEADRHMRELLEITKIEETSNAKSSERKKTKNKAGKTERSKAPHIAIEMKPETNSSNVQKGNDHLIFDGSQHNSDDESNKSVQSTLGDKCKPVTTDLKKDCQSFASCADSAQEESVNMQLKAGLCSTAVPDDPLMTVEKASDEHMHVGQENCVAVEVAVTKIEETINARSVERTKMKNKPGRAERRKAMHIAAEMKLETPSSDAQAGNDHLVFDGSQHKSKGESDKIVKSTRGDKCEPVTTDLKKDCRAFASCADSAQKESDSWTDWAGSCSTKIPDDMVMTNESWESWTTVGRRKVSMRSAVDDIAAEVQLETPSSDAQAGNHHLVFDGSQHKSKGELDKIVKSTLGDKCKPVTTDLKKDCQALASCAESAQEESDDWTDWAGFCSTEVPGDMVLTDESRESGTTVGRRKVSMRSAVDDIAVQKFAVTAKEGTDHGVATWSSVTLAADLEAILAAGFSSSDVDVETSKPQTRDVEVQTMTPTMEAWAALFGKESLCQEGSTCDMQTQMELHDEYVGDYMLDESTPPLLPMIIKPRVPRASCIVASSGEPAKVEHQRIMIGKSHDLFSCSTCDHCVESGQDAASDVSTNCCQEGCCNDISRLDLKLSPDEIASWPFAHEIGEKLSSDEIASWPLADETAEQLSSAEIVSWPLAHERGEKLSSDESLPGLFAHEMGESVWCNGWEDAWGDASRIDLKLSSDESGPWSLAQEVGESVLCNLLEI